MLSALRIMHHFHICRPSHTLAVRSTPSFCCTSFSLPSLRPPLSCSRYSLSHFSKSCHLFRSAPSIPRHHDISIRIRSKYPINHSATLQYILPPLPYCCSCTFTFIRSVLYFIRPFVFHSFLCWLKYSIHRDAFSLLNPLR